MAVVKANAYGHGLRETAMAINNIIDCYGVDDVNELADLRKTTQKPVHILGYVGLDDLERLVILKGEPVVYNKKTLARLDEISKKLNVTSFIHIKLDAFLGRQGILLDDLEEFFIYASSYKNLIVKSLYTHFTNIEDTTNQAHARKQIKLLQKAHIIAYKCGLTRIYTHISSTAGILAYERDMHSNALVRLGIGLYGLWPSNSLKRRFEESVTLRPALKWVSRVAQVKTLPKGFPVGYGLTYTTPRRMTIAVVPQGYSDGYDRLLSNKGEMLIHGKRCKVLGRVAMNMCMVDVTHVKKVRLEDEIVILGRQKNEEITAEELAEKCRTINYEIVSRISPLLPRIVV